MILREQGYHVTNFARKTKVSSYKCWHWKIKLSRLLVQRINEFKMNEIQRKAPVKFKTVLTNSNCPWTNKLQTGRRWLKTYWQSCVTLCTIWDCLTVCSTRNCQIANYCCRLRVTILNLIMGWQSNKNVLFWDTTWLFDN